MKEGSRLREASARRVRCVALGDRADVELHLRIGEVDGLVFRVENQVVDVHMLRGGLQILHRRKLGVVRVIQPRLAVFVPDGKHAALATFVCPLTSS